MKLNNKIAIMGAGSVLLTAMALILLAVWQSRGYNSLAQEEVNKLIESDMNHITQGIYNLVHTENEAVQSQIDNNLKVAQYILESSGKIELDKEYVEWDAINQFTQQSKYVRLPKMLVNNQWLQKNTSFNQITPIVDKVSSLVGETATIFQRMNEQGDMLRVATTVKTITDERAISTYIPAVNPDGSSNPVIATILQGETYHGRAYVVNDWYLTTYEPIYDDTETLIGMLYVGTKQQTVAARIRKAILQTSVGDTGYVYVISGRGEDRGKYIISQRGERDGEDIWATQDPDGQLIIQNIINAAVSLNAGSMVTVRYQWKNPTDPQPRWKIARLAYYAPWDWVIGTSIYEDEVLSYSEVLIDGRLKMIRSMLIVGSIIAVLIALIAMCAAWVILRPVKEMTVIAQKITEGDHSETVQVRSKDEIGILAITFNQMSKELYQAIGSLRASEEKYRNIFEYAREGLFQSTPTGRFISANPAAARILGYDSPDELIAEITDLSNQFYVDSSDCDTFFESISKHKDISSFEAQCFSKNGQKIWVAISAHMPNDDKGQEQIIYGFIRDTTKERQAEADRKSLESQLVQSQKMEALGLLAGGVAHDLNNVLSGIVSYPDLLLLDMPEDSPLRKPLLTIQDSGRKAEAIVQDLLTLARRGVTSTKVINLNQLLQEYLGSPEHSAIMSYYPNIRVHVDLAPMPDNIEGSAVHIKKTIMNLISNAAEAIGEKGRIEATTFNCALKKPLKGYEEIIKGKYCGLRIQDTGCGISNEDITHIFEPFYTKKVMGKSGTGLGMSVVWGTVQDHNGYITVDSLPGEGTTFELYFPATQKTRDREVKDIEIEKYTGNGEHILVVDDNEKQREIACAFLDRLGYQTNAVSSGEEALVFLGYVSVNLVILDMIMDPGIDGLETYRRIKEKFPDQNVIIASGYSKTDRLREALRLGAREYVKKPYSLEHIGLAVRRAL